MQAFFNIDKVQLSDKVIRPTHYQLTTPTCKGSIVSIVTYVTVNYCLASSNNKKAKLSQR